jgi:hypothetical protein
MSWAAIFWILYGAGSSLFVIYLFKLGKNVASNRKELVREEIQRLRSGQSDETGTVEPVVAGKLTQSVAGDDPTRLHVQQIYQPDSDHVAVQVVRDGANRVINLRVGQGDAVARANSESFSGTEKHS